MANGANIAGTALSTGATAAATAGSLFTAATAANAVPIGGQVASAVLAIAGGLTMAFGGKRRQKREAGKAEQMAKQEANKQSMQPSIPGPNQDVLNAAEPMVSAQTTAPVPMAQTPVYQSYNQNSQEPTVQPQTLYNRGTYG